MKDLTFLILAMVLANTAPAQGTKGRMYNGFDVRRNQFPSLVRLEQNFIFYKTECSGTLIRDNCVLTAGHCVSRNGVKPTSIRVCMGSEKRYSSDEICVTVDSIENNVIIHPDFDYEKRQNDIALIRIPKVDITKNNNIAVASITPKTQYVCKNVEVAGWGVLDDSGTESSYAQWRGGFTIYDDEHCPTKFAYMVPNRMCLYREYASSCGGDSGGPALCGTQVVGVASVISSKGCESNNAMIYANVTYYVDWITKNTQN